jgi:hypothetical protein
MTKKAKKKAPARATQAPVTDHGVDHGHDTRVDEPSAYNATHQSEAVQWQRPSSLEAPDARDGMTQRWVRHSLRGEADPRNMNRKYREGWRPRDPATLSEDWQVFAITAESTDGYIKVDDLVLMEIPTKTLTQRKAASEQAAREQMAGVEHDLERSQMPGLPITKEHRTSVSHPAVRVADNE